MEVTQVATKTTTNLTSFKGTGKAGLTDISLYIQAGINPLTGRPLREGISSIENFKKLFRIIDEQDAVNRFEWEGLPATINGQQLERLLYYKGQLLFFKFQGVYYFMPYTLDGTIDFYGRYNRVHPVPMTSGTDKGNKSDSGRQMSLLATLKIKPIYDLNQIVEGETYETEATPTNEAYGVILRDYTNQLPQEILPRYQLNDCLLNLEAECLCYLQTSMIVGSGISGVRVPDTDSQDEVIHGALGLKDYAIKGIPWIPIKGSIEFQELTGGERTAIQDYFLAMQSLDNLRLSTYGLDNTGVFEKQSHILNEENQINQQKYHYVQIDSLKIREDFCKIVEKLFGVQIKVNIPEANSETIGGVMPENRNISSVTNNYGGSNNEDSND